MYMVLVIAQTIAFTVATAAAGILLCWSLWLLFRLIRHPAWGSPLVLIPLALAMAGKLPESEFIRRMLTFAAAAAGPFCIAGLVWRANRRDHPRVGAISSPRDDPPPHYLLYPAIAACICEARHPSPGELKRVTRRIWCEAYAARYPTPGFAEWRTALRAARAALDGN
jgi:drug/metabolite transporter superfamily protein YnfA